MTAISTPAPVVPGRLEQMSTRIAFLSQVLVSRPGRRSPTAHREAETAKAHRG